ncbi:murein transglycosylase [Vibrio inusitatus NBRC 102082]|uniref:Murein transglycosylase n=1 Tax=Vibrio inusitatus NBRC 102082 TaxID=1219070 RepID=A0A4Y3HWM9_9VIBR|nr:DUF1214 domain-containing protein [Vibrio inusitatus]GEA51477.1 murein transglycosylase [Vibrio inusitatus NBRC 102082]
MKKLTLALCMAAMAATVIAEESKVSVTEDNYAHVMFDLGIKAEVSQGADNDWHHHRAPIALDKQPAPMMNRDTLYSFHGFDGAKDATVTIPEMDGRYVSVQVMTHDHITAYVFYGSGTFLIKAEDITPYTMLYVRTQVDAADAADIKKANNYQNQYKVEYVEQGFEPKAYQPTPWDMETFKPLHAHYTAEAKEVGVDFTMGTVQKPVSQAMNNRGASIATGLLPDAHAMYKNGNYTVDKNQCYSVTYDVPAQTDPELGFFSITIYDDTQYLATDANSIITSRDIILNDNNTFTVHYGNTASCGEVNNLLHVPTNEFNITMRVYLPEVDKIAAYELPNVK